MIFDLTWQNATLFSCNPREGGNENNQSVSVWGRRGQTPSPWRSRQILEVIVGKEHIHRE